MAPRSDGSLAAGLAPSASPGRRRWSSVVRWVPSLAIGAVLAYLVVVPIALMLLSSVRPGGFPLDPGLTLGHYASVYGDPGFPALLWATVEFGVGSSVVALAIGLGLAWLIERTDLPARGVVRVLILLPMATPPLLMAIAWAMLLSPRVGFINQILTDAFGLRTAPFNIYSMLGLIFVQGLAFVPTAYLILAPSFRNFDPSFEEAAMTSGAGTWRLIRRILLPVLWPSILSAAVFLLMVSLVVFDVPGTLGTPAHITVLSTRIYYLVSDSPGGIPLYGRVGALAALFLVLLLALASAYHRLTLQAQRYRTVTGKAFRPRAMRLGRARPAAILAVIAYFLLSVAAPVAALVWMSLMPYQTRISWPALRLATFDNYRDLFVNGRVVASVAHSAAIAVSTATAVTVLALLVSWLAVRLKVPGGRVLDALAFAPVAIPGVMIGVALVYVYLTLNGIVPIYGTIWIIVVAYVTQYLPFGSRTMSGVMLQLHPELEEAALTSGAGRVRILWRITLPLMWPAAAAVWIWVAAHALRELSSALMLQGRENSVVPTLLWDYWAGGEPTRAAAVGVGLTLTLVLILGLWQAASRRGTKFV
ncbi:MAG TPA: iron ABC transporter permease [Alphaproteobacteria bacterium]|nr:iron ABC transporter permease [Alphaproteobacteria bacterium]